MSTKLYIQRKIHNRRLDIIRSMKEIMVDAYPALRRRMPQTQEEWSNVFYTFSKDHPHYHWTMADEDADWIILYFTNN